MIVKQKPEDFQVEELTAVVPTAGPFALYRLEKTGWGTPDALQAIRRRWRIDHRRISYGGLKDRHAHTVQHFTIFHGPQRRLTQQGLTDLGFTVTFVGHVGEPFTAEHIQANRFKIVVRNLAPADVDKATQAFEEVSQSGVPNYFDDQRFGSVSGGGPFLAKAIMLGDYEKALRLALTAPYPHDRRPQKKEKAILRAHWGDWAVAKEKLERSHARSLVDYLVGHPTDFRGALERLRPELRGLYLSAYQSHLWNRMLAGYVRALVPLDRLVEVPLLLGDVPMHRPPRDRTASDGLPILQDLRLPLHNHRAILAESDPAKPFFDRVLREENLTLEQFKLKGFREMFFSRGDRPALCKPSALHMEALPDEAHGGKSKLQITFDLPRGSYATLILKRLTAWTPAAALSSTTEGTKDTEWKQSLPGIRPEAPC